MTTVEIPTQVCHKCGTKICGPEATIGNSCYDNPLWNALPCLEPYDTLLVTCAPQTLTLTPAVPVSLPLVPEREEPPSAV